MWPFKKKGVETLDLPPLPRKGDEEITLLPENGVVPEELPLLQKPSRIEMPQKEIPVTETISSMPKPATRKVSKAVISEKFMRMDDYKKVLGEINEIDSGFDNIESEVSRIVEVKDSRHEKIDMLQGTLEDVSKKLIIIENTLFGG
jgi:hypothetical protein